MQNHNKITLPKQMSTQDIIKRSEELHGTGYDWKKTYAGIHKLLETNQFRILRESNTLFLIRILSPKNAAMFVFDADTPKNFIRNFKGFMKAMHKSGYETVTGTTSNTKIFELVKRAGFPISIEDTGKKHRGDKVYKGTVDIRETK
jgi:hypothetical protein